MPLPLAPIVIGGARLLVEVVKKIIAVKAAQKVSETVKSFLSSERQNAPVGIIEGDFFHRTRTEAGKGDNFGGVNLGTKKAAEDRLTGTQASSGRNLGRVDKFKVKLGKTLGTEADPITENELFSIVNLPSRLNILKEEGFDGIVYRNEVEDPGSNSVVAFDVSSINKKRGGK